MLKVNMSVLSQPIGSELDHPFDVRVNELLENRPPKLQRMQIPGPFESFPRGLRQPHLQCVGDPSKKFHMTDSTTF